MATSTVNPLEEHISCSVCLEVYTDPHILNCLHTFCYQCIQGVKQGDTVPCPECRQQTDLSEVKKDFKMVSLIEIYKNTSGKDDSDTPQENVCDACKSSTKSVQNFCKNCKELLCVDCFKAHTGMKLTKDHTVITFAELHRSEKQKIDEAINALTTRERDLEIICISDRDFIENIMQEEVKQMAEVNQQRQSILDDVNSHHDSLLSQIQSINRDKVRNLQQQEQILIEARQQLADKKKVLADVSQTNNVALITDTLEKVTEQTIQEQAAVLYNLQTAGSSLKGSVQVVKGSKWNPDTSTRIEEAATPAKKQEIHPRYREVKRVEIKFQPYKLCVSRNKLWMAGGAGGLFVYKGDLQEIKQITNEKLKLVVSVVATDTNIVVCDFNTGLHLFHQQGDYLKHVCSGHFSDVSVTNYTLFALEHAKQHVHVFTRSQGNWVKARELDLSGCSEDFSGERLCTTSFCIYVSSCKTHCVCVYSLTGEFVCKIGEQGKGEGLETGKFHNPLICDMDSNGKLLLCDSGNHRLQWFDPQTRKWAGIQGLEGLESPVCAGVGVKHILVGTQRNKLLKYEAVTEST